MIDYTKHSQPIKICQICGNNELDSMLFLGYVTPVNTMPQINQPPEEEPAFPLELKRCSKCSLAQIGLEVEPKMLFPPEYPYLSASTKILRKNFAELCEESSKIIGLTKDDLVIDIGSNDGTLLSNFKNARFRVLGIEPTNAAKIANDNNIETINEFFSYDLAKKVKLEKGTAKLITAANVFAHIVDVHSVVKGIITLLDDNGVFISENHYLVSLVETLQYDTIYHEHLRYYSLTSLQYLFDQHGLEIFHAKRIPTHGGSIRVYTARKGKYKVKKSVKKILEYEKQHGFKNGDAFTAFHQGVVDSKTDLISLLGKLKRDGSRVYGIGAPSRASTLINYAGLNCDLVNCVMEISTSHKLNKYMPGTRIPVLDEKKLYEDQPEYALLLSWHIADELIANLKRKGYKGKFIIPLKNVRIIE
jgi:hypothetical protein